MANSAHDVAEKIGDSVEELFFMACFAIKITALYIEDQCNKILESEYIDYMAKNITSDICTKTYTTGVKFILTLTLTAVCFAPKSIKRMTSMSIHSVANMCGTHTFHKYSRALKGDVSAHNQYDEWVNVDDEPAAESVLNNNAVSHMMINDSLRGWQVVDNSRSSQQSLEEECHADTTLFLNGKEIKIIHDYFI